MRTEGRGEGEGAMGDKARGRWATRRGEEESMQRNLSYHASALSIGLIRKSCFVTL